MQRVWVRSDIKQNEEHRELCKMLLDLGHEWSALPPFPMKVFPQAIGACVLRGYCHHRIYKTHDTSTSKLVSVDLIPCLAICSCAIYVCVWKFNYCPRYLQLNQLLDTANQIGCYRYSRCVCQALHHILIVSME